MKRALAVALAGLALSVPTAAAQDATPVVGGGSFNDAPVLEPGRYRDTIITREQLFYAIELGAGEQLRLGARLIDVDREGFERATSVINVHLYGPLRQRETRGPAEDLTGGGNSMFSADDEVGLLIEPVKAFADTVSEPVYRGAGTWYVGLASIWGSSSEAPKIELPVELELGVEQTPVTEQPDPTVAPPTPTATAPGGDSGSEPEDDGDGPAAAAVAGIGAGGLALGALLGGLAGRRRRS